MHKCAPDIKSSVQKYQCPVHRDRTYFGQHPCTEQWAKSYLTRKIFIVTLLLKKVMAGVYTEETFKPLTQPHIIDLFLKMKKHTDSTISKLNDKIINLNANFKRLEFDVQVCRKVNDGLVKQAVSLECQCWRNAL